jgi:hypothetical protein
MPGTVGVRLGAALAAAGAFAAGVVLAIHHPSHPRFALAAFSLWCVAAIRWPRLWLYALPACLPAASLAPWTGWLVFDEFDLVVMGAAAAGFLFLARHEAAVDRPAGSRPRLVLPLLCVFTASLATVHGLAAASDGPVGWYDGYSSPLNALRVGKGLLYALLMAPLIRRAIRASECDTLRSVAAGMLTGIGIVVAAIIIERSIYAGLFDFGQPYRTTALFWEMHVGGAALDGYLALAWPVVAWAVLRSRKRWCWTATAALALLVEYACLTTFSRGLYLGVAGGLVLLSLQLSRRTVRPSLPSWRRRADLILALALFAQLAAVIGTESFMRTRVRETGDDLTRRLRHWGHGVALLKNPTDWWLGRGAGRLPLEYADSTPEDDFPGSAQVVSDLDGPRLILRGPRRSEALAGRYAMTQQVTLETGYRIAFDVHVDRPQRLGISVCSTHLLYEGACQRAVFIVLPGATDWQRLSAILAGASLPGNRGLVDGATFAIVALDVDARIELRHLDLVGDRSVNLLRNVDFSDGLAHWFPVARNYFVPWHIDNFYLELLIEQGVAGLTAVLLLLGSALAALLSARRRDSPAAPYLAACLVSVLLVGTVSSLLDVPRVAFLLFFLALLSIELDATRGKPRPC